MNCGTSARFSRGSLYGKCSLLQYCISARFEVTESSIRVSEEVHICLSNTNAAYLFPYQIVLHSFGSIFVFISMNDEIVAHYEIIVSKFSSIFF